MLVVIAAAGVALITLNSQNPQQLPETALPNIQAGLSSIPAHDVTGTEPAGVPRPPQSTRSYYLQRGKVTLVIYGSRQSIPDVRAAVEPLLARGGWTPVEPATTAAPSAGDVSPSRLWRADYFREGAVLQVAMFHTRDITSIDYTLQAAP